MFTESLIDFVNYLGNIIMPTLSGLCFVVGIFNLSNGDRAGRYFWGGLLCLCASGFVRLFEQFAAPMSGHDDHPDLYWNAIMNLVNWLGNVVMPVYAGLQLFLCAATLMDVGYKFNPKHGPSKHLAAAVLALTVSGLVRLAEQFVTTAQSVTGVGSGGS